MKSIAIGAAWWMEGSIANESQPFCTSHAAAAALAHAVKLTTDEVVKLQPVLRFLGLSKADEIGLPQRPSLPEQTPA
jgi:hypothetical protein